MFGITNYGVFILSGILLNLTPGSDTIYILGRGMQGRKAGVISALGISTGCLIHTVMAALGLSVILSKSALAFNIIKLLGAGYLIYLGIKSIKSDNSLLIQKCNTEKISLKKMYFDGVLTNTLNPKVALFFLAFLPQFISPDNAYGAVPFLLLGLTFIITGTVWFLILAILSSIIAEKLKGKNKFSDALNKITGLIFVALGLNLLRAKSN